MCQKSIPYGLATRGCCCAQDLPWFSMLSLLGKLAKILSPSWVCSDLGKLTFYLREVRL